MLPSGKGRAMPGPGPATVPMTAAGAEGLSSGRPVPVTGSTTGAEVGAGPPVYPRTAAAGAALFPAPRLMA